MKPEAEMKNHFITYKRRQQKELISSMKQMENIPLTLEDNFIYHEPNYGSESEIYSDSESELDKFLETLYSDVCPRDVEESWITGTETTASDVFGLDLFSRTKVGQDQEREILIGSRRNRSGSPSETIARDALDLDPVYSMGTATRRIRMASVIYHQPNYGSESDKCPDSESESDKCLDSDVCPRVDVTELVSSKTGPKTMASDVLGLDLVSHTKVGEDQEWNTAQDTHLTRHENIRMLAAAKTSSIIYRKRNYGSESNKCADSDVCPRVDIGESWKTGLFDCHQNITIAAEVTFCPWVAFGQIAEVLHEGEMTCPVGSFIYLSMMPLLCSQRIIGSMYREKLRRKLNLVEDPCEDWASHMFCHYCSLCQEYRELQIRGLDPSLGWKGILAQQQGMQKRSQDLVQCPPRTQAMSK